MKLSVGDKKPLKEGDSRNKAGFLFLPKKLGNEWRWLEKAKWRQRCMRLTDPGPPGGGYSPGQTSLKWVSTEWL